MVRFLVLYNTPKDTEAFERHYREVHIPLIKKLPGLRRCTIGQHAIPVRDDEPYYWIVELEWDNMDALQKAFQSPEGLATAQDVANLASSAGVRSMVYEAEEVYSGLQKP